MSQVFKMLIEFLDLELEVFQGSDFPTATLNQINKS